MEERKPALNVWCIDGSTDGRWFWQLDRFDTFPECLQKVVTQRPSFRLPPEVFDKLEGGELEVLFTAKNRIYDTFEDAMKALTHATKTD